MCTGKMRTFIKGILVFLFPIISHSQSQDFYFNHLTTEDGLIDNLVRGAVKDHEGFMWIATNEGLDRFDGTNFRHYLSGINVMDLVLTKDSTIWMAAQSGGLIRKLPYSDSLSHFFTSPYKEFVKLYRDHSDQIWVGSYHQGFFKLDAKSNQLIPHQIRKESKENSFQYNSALAFAENLSEKNSLWIAANNAGLYSFNKVTEQKKHIPFIVKNKDGSMGIESNMAAMCLYQNTSNQLWVGTWGRGLGEYDPLENKWSYHNKIINDDGSTESLVVIRDIKQKSNDELWVSAEEQGLLIFDIRKKIFLPIKKTAKKGSILSNRAIGVYQDQDKRQWIFNSSSSSGDGISILDPTNQIFNYHSLSDDKACPALKEPISFSRDERNNRLYVTNRGCRFLYVYDENFKLIYSSSLPLIENNTSGHHYFKVIVRKNGEVLLGGRIKDTSNRSLLIFDFAKKQFYDFQHPQLEQFRIDTMSINDMVEDKQGQLWLTTKANGIIKVTEQQIIQYPLSALISDWKSEENYVIGNLSFSNSGKIFMEINSSMDVLYPSKSQLILFDPETQKASKLPFETHKGYTPTITSSIMRKEGEVWVGTKEFGLWKMDYQGDSAVCVRVQNEAFTKSKIDRLIKDLNGNLWITTTNGLWNYNVADESFTQYTKNQGIKDPGFIDSGLDITSTGEIYFSQDEGFYHFHPNQIPSTNTKMPIHFTTLNLLSSKELKNIEQLDKIDLPYKDGSFSIQFAAIDYGLKSKKIFYSYRLSPNEDQWTNIGELNQLTFSNLNPDKYQLHIRASKDIEFRNASEKYINITIATPWWRSTLAYLCYLLLLGGALFFINRQQLNRQFAQAEAKRFKELDDLKTSFYTNITHELRTPLTIILGMVNQVRTKPEQHFQEGLDMIQRNGQSLLKLVNQMLDLRKLEVGKMQLQMQQGDIIQYIKKLCGSFEAFAKSKNIKLHFLSESSSLQMDFDPDQLLNIVSNLISNAIKFTPPEGDIYVQLSQHNNQFQIKVKDTGVGIPADHLDRIFDRFTQVDNSTTRKAEGTGIGLSLVKELVKIWNGSIEVKSEVDVGTVFAVSLPITRQATENFTVEHQEKMVSNVFSFAPVGKYQKESVDNTLTEHSASTLENLSQILIVEDNPDLRKYLQSCLNEKYQISLAKDGEEGIQKALTNIPDIIISDIMMPKKNGYELCATLKQDERTSHIPIILLTAKADFESKIKGLKHGADNYLKKPFNQEELLLRLGNLIQLQKKQQQRYGQLDQLPTIVNPTENIDDAFVLKIQEFILQNLENDALNVHDISKIVFLSRTQVHRKLKALTGMSTSQFIRTIRLNKAMELLQSSEKSISDIAFSTGFKNLSYFSRVFAEQFGQSANSIRK